LLGDGDKAIEIVYFEGKNILFWANYRSQGRTKKLFYRHNTTNDPTKAGPLSFVLFESSFTSVSTVNMGHPTLVSLAITYVVLTIQTPTESPFKAPPRVSIAVLMSCSRL
jgi:hypothetical protein